MIWWKNWIESWKIVGLDEEEHPQIVGKMIRISSRGNFLQSNFMSQNPCCLIFFQQNCFEFIRNQCVQQLNGFNVEKESLGSERTLRAIRLTLTLCSSGQPNESNSVSEQVNLKIKKFGLVIRIPKECVFLNRAQSGHFNHTDVHPCRICWAVDLDFVNSDIGMGKNRTDFHSQSRRYFQGT